MRSVEDIEAVMSVLLQNGKVQRATHNIMAFRIYLPDKGTYLQVSGTYSILRQSSRDQFCDCIISLLPLLVSEITTGADKANACLYYTENHDNDAKLLASGTCSDTIPFQDFDDDGESAAGARLLHLLQILDAKDVVVVVSRWFGGIHLGPARFTHINNAARMLLDQCGYVSKDTEARKKKKGR